MCIFILWSNGVFRKGTNGIYFLNIIKAIYAIAKSIALNCKFENDVILKIAARDFR